MDFADHFSSMARQYAEFRPRYPDALFAWLAGIAPGKNLVWDCACGNGQASQGLATYFERVVATDASAAQIGEAAPNPKIQYRVARAEESGIDAQSADMITVAQAAHWLKLEDFYQEARRVAKPKGILALWCYEFFTTADDRIIGCMKDFYENTVGPYWPPERAYVREGYRTLPFPFADQIEAPVNPMTVSWKLSQILGYFRSWSATKRFREEKGVDPVIDLEKKLAALWGDPGEAKTLTFPLSLRVARL